jgi:hypothetical protein
VRSRRGDDDFRREPVACKGETRYEEKKGVQPILSVHPSTRLLAQVKKHSQLMTSPRPFIESYSRQLRIQYFPTSRLTERLLSTTPPNRAIPQTPPYLDGSMSPVSAISRGDLLPVAAAG